MQLKEVADELKRIEELDAHEASVAFARLLHERLVHAFTSLPAAAFF